MGASDVTFSGYKGQVRFSTGTLMQMATWDYSGPTREIIEKGTGFNEDFKKKFTGALDGGTITVNGSYVAAATAVGTLLASVQAGTAISGLKLHYSPTGWFAMSATDCPNGTTIIENVAGPVVDSNGVAEITFNFTVNDGYFDKQA